jgi:hypothetical protein
MPGRYIRIGTRWTYFPPFVNERLKGNHTDAKGHSLDGPPFWSCTFTALMYGINFAFLGHKPARASHDEIVALALASGDNDLRGGATTKLMQAALKARFGKTKDQAALGPKTVKQRLAGGEMLVAGVRSAGLNDHFRRFIGNSGALHRVAFVGFRVVDGVEQTRILDPMAIPSKSGFPDPTAYAGEWFPMNQYVKAAFSDEQLWFQPGEFLDLAPRTVVRSFPAPRDVTMHAGARIVGRDRRRPERKVLDRTLVNEEHARFDRIVAATVNDALVEYLRIVGGPFDSLFVRRSNPGLTADIPAIAPAAPVGASPVGAPAANEDVDDDPLPPPIVVPDDPVPPGREAPKDVRSTPIESDLDDDPDGEAPPEEDTTAEASEGLDPTPAVQTQPDLREVGPRGAR